MTRHVYILIFVLIGMSQDVLGDYQVKQTIEYESPIYAQAGPVVLTQADIDAAVLRVPKDQRAGYLADLQNISSVTENLLLGYLLFEDGKNGGLYDTPRAQAQFRSALMQVAAAMAREHFLESVELDDYTQLAREIYLSEPELFFGDDKVTLQYAFASPIDDVSESDLMQLIVNVHARMEQEEEISSVTDEFAESENLEVGLVSAVPEGELMESVRSVLARLGPDELSAPFRSGEGWHIVRLVEREPGSVREWESVQEEAINIARDRHLRRALGAHVKQLQDQPISFADNAIRDLQDRFGATAIREQLLEDSSN